MNTFIVYSGYDQSRHWPGQHAPVGVTAHDWYDRAARKALTDETGYLWVGRFPTVYIWAEEWLDYTHDADNPETVDAGWVGCVEPDDWPAVETFAADYADRTARGWAAGIVKPEAGGLTWTNRPPVGGGEVAVPSWTGDAEQGWTLTWTIEQEQEGDDDSDDG